MKLFSKTSNKHEFSHIDYVLNLLDDLGDKTEFNTQEMKYEYAYTLEDREQRYVFDWIKNNG